MKKKATGTTVFSLLISKTGKRVFQIDGALVGIIARYECLHSALYGVDIHLISVHFIQTIMPLLLYEFNDQNSVKGTYMIFVPLPIESSTIPDHFR